MARTKSNNAPQHPLQSNVCSTSATPASTIINTVGNPNGLTAYELYRAKNIERNQRRLADLDLITQEEAQTVIDSAWKKDRVIEEYQIQTNTSGHAKGKRASGKKGKGGPGSSSSGVQKARSSSRVKRGTIKSSTAAKNKRSSTATKSKGVEKLLVPEIDLCESMWV